MTAAAPVGFDESLAVMAKAVGEAFGYEALADGVILRDVSGRLSFVAVREASSEEERSA